MAVAIYMDVHIPRSITLGLRIRGTDILTAQEDNSENLSDSALLDRATALQRCLFSFDDDLLAEAQKRQKEGAHFSGVIYAHPLKVSIGRCINDLEIICRAGEPKDLADRVEFLPL